MNWREDEWGKTGSGASGGSRIMRKEASVHNKLAEVWGFAESDTRRFD